MTGIFLGSLDSQERRSLVNTSANAAYAEPGYLLYLRDKTLVAQPFDKRHYVVSGEPHTLSDEVLYFPQVQGCFQCLQWGGSGHANAGKGVPFSQLTWFAFSRWIGFYQPLAPRLLARSMAP